MIVAVLNWGGLCHGSGEMTSQVIVLQFSGDDMTLTLGWPHPESHYCTVSEHNGGSLPPASVISSWGALCSQLLFSFSLHIWLRPFTGDGLSVANRVSKRLITVGLVCSSRPTCLQFTTTKLVAEERKRVLVLLQHKRVKLCTSTTSRIIQKRILEMTNSWVNGDELPGWKFPSDFQWRHRYHVSVWCWLANSMSKFSKTFVYDVYVPLCTVLELSWSCCRPGHSN